MSGGSVKLGLWAVLVEGWLVNRSALIAQNRGKDGVAALGDSLVSSMGPLQLSAAWAKFMQSWARRAIGIGPGRNI